MKSVEFLTEGASHPIICIDVQPEYAYYGNNEGICAKIINFVALQQTGPVLMMVNAERDMVSGDTVAQIKQYWAETVGGEPVYDEENDEYLEPESNINWSRFQVADKGYGHIRAYMDQGISDAAIIRLIRHLYMNKLNDARDLDLQTLQQIIGTEYQDWMEDEGFSINWTSVAQLKKFNGSYLVGGGRNECLREVELLMNAFNIKYRRVDSLIYG